MDGANIPLNARSIWPSRSIGDETVGQSKEKGRRHEGELAANARRICNGAMGRAAKSTAEYKIPKQGDAGNSRTYNPRQRSSSKIPR